MNDFGRIAVCGMIAGYDGEPVPMANPQVILRARLRVEGFIVSEHMDVWSQAQAEIGGRVADGTLKYRESVAEGPRRRARSVPGHAQGAQLRQAAREAGLIRFHAPTA